MGPIMREIYNKGFAEGFEIGRKEGLEIVRKEEARNMARHMILTGSIPLSKIAEYSGLTLEEVQRIRNSMNL